MANKIDEESNPLIAINDVDRANNNDNHVGVDLDVDKKKKSLQFTPAEIPVTIKYIDSTSSEQQPMWTANGFPIPQGSVIGEPMRRNQWDSSLLACFGRNDEFCSSDLEVFLGAWRLVFFMEPMRRDLALDQLLGLSPIIA